jgi:hypothetical protein
LHARKTGAAGLGVRRLAKRLALATYWQIRVARQSLLRQTKETEVETAEAACKSHWARLDEVDVAVAERVKS